MHITLRPNEKIYINGAVLRVDRKVSLELMNDAVFLLESHVMLENKATTPLRKLYFIVQLMLIDLKDRDSKMLLLERQSQAVATAYGEGLIRTGLSAATELARRNRPFEALKVIRSMLPIEDQVIAQALETVDEARPVPTSAPAPQRPPRASFPTPPPSVRDSAAQGVPVA